VFLLDTTSKPATFLILATLTGIIITLAVHRFPLPTPR